MQLIEAQKISSYLFEKLSPHCDRIAIAGSIRREKEQVGDIEIVCIPRTVAGSKSDLFGNSSTIERSPGFVSVVDSMEKIKGDAVAGKYMQRLCKMEYAKKGPDNEIIRIPMEEIKVDIFTATYDNWGYILAIRTGSDNFSKRLAQSWVANGYQGIDGMLTKNKHPVIVREEVDLFRLLRMTFVEPKNRI